MSEQPREYETISDAARRTKLSRKTLYRRIREGRLTAHRAGPRLIRLDPREVDALLDPIRHDARAAEALARSLADLVAHHRPFSDAELAHLAELLAPVTRRSA